MNFRLEHAAAIGKEQNIVVRACAEEMRKEIFVGNIRTDQAFAAAFLRFERVRRQTLDIAAGRNRDDRVFVGDQDLRRSSIRAHARQPASCAHRHIFLSVLSLRL